MVLPEMRAPRVPNAWIAEPDVAVAAPWPTTVLFVTAHPRASSVGVPRVSQAPAMMMPCWRDPSVTVEST